MTLVGWRRLWQVFAGCSQPIQMQVPAPPVLVLVTGFKPPLLRPVIARIRKRSLLVTHGALARRRTRPCRTHPGTRSSCPLQSIGHRAGSMSGQLQTSEQSHCANCHPSSTKRVSQYLIISHVPIRVSGGSGKSTLQGCFSKRIRTQTWVSLSSITC